MTAPRTLLKAWNIRPQERLSQNFLSNPSIARKIISRAELDSDDVVLEIGAGLGALTIPAARLVRRLVAVEKDLRIIELLKTELIVNRIKNVSILPHSVFDVQIENIAAETEKPIIVLGNLPYHVSSQILVRLIFARNVIDKAILTFQREMAQRLIAQPGNKAYGRLTVMLGYCGKIRKLATIDAKSFYPQPRVDSEVVEIKFMTQLPYSARDEIRLYQVIKSAFGNRRKTLKNALSTGTPNISPADLMHALQAAGIDPKRRAETLTVAEFVNLENNLHQLMPITEGGRHGR
jgi:16S rRNA (adenine1518-N6/adenine1519-N6)-dimethyltransferase